MLDILRGKSEIDFGNRSKFGVVEKEIHPKFGGRIRYQGTSWNAREIKDRKSTRLNSSHIQKSRMPSSA